MILFGLFYALLRQIQEVFFQVSQKTRMCRKDLKRKTQNLLEWAENRRNFASEIRNDIDL